MKKKKEKQEERAIRRDLVWGVLTSMKGANTQPRCTTRERERRKIGYKKKSGAKERE